jgi:hypothetical protein
MECMNKLCGQHAEVFNIKGGIMYSYHCDLQASGAHPSGGGGGCQDAAHPKHLRTGI